MADELPPLRLNEVKELVARYRAEGRTPDSVEQEALKGLVAAYIMRDARGTAADLHEQRHLRAGIEVSSNGRCRPGFCPLEVSYYLDPRGPRIKVALDAPYGSRDSDADHR